MEIIIYWDECILERVNHKWQSSVDVLSRFKLIRLPGRSLQIDINKIKLYAFCYDLGKAYAVVFLEITYQEHQNTSGAISN